MKKVNLGFSKYTEANLLVIAQAILAALTTNAFFPTPVPTLVVLQTAITDYSEALSAAKDGGKTNIAVKNARKEELIALLIQLGNYVMLTANGNDEMLGTSGFPVSKTKEPSPPLVKPEIIKMEDGLNSGELQVTISSVAGARNYVYQYTQDPLTLTSQWTSSNTTLTKMLFTDLEPGKKYWSRAIVYGIKEQQVFGDPVLSQLIR
jgi:hypothetical protein